MRIGLLGQGAGAVVCAWLATAAETTAIAAATVRIERFTEVSMRRSRIGSSNVRVSSPIDR
jgi:hypothetical protein